VGDAPVYANRRTGVVQTDGHIEESQTGRQRRDRWTARPETDTEQKDEQTEERHTDRRT
jgi:hypothetical protein